MSELLRKANELVEARDRATDGEWVGDDYSIYTNAVGGDYIIGGKHASEEDIEFITLAANHGVDIIRGYQGLLRRVIDGWNQKYYHSDDVERYRILKAEIEKSLPGDESHE